MARTRTRVTHDVRHECRLSEFATSADFLLARGWAPDSNPIWPECRWRDPQAPQQDTEERVYLTAKDSSGQTVPLMRDHGREWPPRMEQVFQIRKTFAAAPMSLREALDIQLAREKNTEKSLAS